MSLLRLCLLSLWLALTNSPVAAAVSQRVPSGAELFFREGLFHAYLQRYFDAISRLDSELVQHYALDEPALDTLAPNRWQAELWVGDLELSYRMHQKAGRALARLLGAEVDRLTRDQAAYRLARLLYQKGYLSEALAALQLSSDKPPEELRGTGIMLKAQIEILAGRFGDAVSTLEGFKRRGELEEYANFNLAVSYIGNGQIEQGIALLDKVGQTIANEGELRALRDKANLVLGYQYLSAKQAVDSRHYLERVSLQGPFANQALLGIGWADIEGQQFQRALVPWTHLQRRDTSDAAVQESLLALPYAYSQLEAYGKSATLYNQAVTIVEVQIERLENAIRQIRGGQLIAILSEAGDADWISKLSELPQAPDTNYLLDIAATLDFQEAVQNYRDLLFLRDRLDKQLKNIAVYRQMVGIRRDHFQGILPRIEQHFSVLDQRFTFIQSERDKIADTLQRLRSGKKPQLFAMPFQKLAFKRLEKLQTALDLSPNGNLKRQRQQRIHRLRGILNWQLEQQYHERFTQAQRNLVQLDTTISSAREQHRLYLYARQAATQGHAGFDIVINRFEGRLTQLRRNTAGLLGRQGRYLERRTIRELEQRMAKLNAAQSKARFALAESYDRATQKQRATQRDKAEQEKADAAAVEGDAAEGNADAAEGDAAAAESDAAAAEGDTAAAEDDADAAEGDAAAAEGDAAAAEGDAAAAEGDAAAAEGDAAAAEGDAADAAEGDADAAEDDAAAVESNADAAEGDADAAEDDAAAVEGNADAAEGNADAAEDDAAAVEGNADAEGDAAAAEDDATAVESEDINK